MIVLGEQSPRWLREMARFVQIKNLLFVYGNVHDLVSFPIQTDGEVRWTESDLPVFFRRFLDGLGYEVVGWADPVEDLSFATSEMEQVFEGVERSHGDPAETDDEGATRKAPPAKRWRDRLRLPQLGPVDWNRTIARIASGLQNTRVPCAFVIDLASRLASSPDRLTRDERTLLTKVLKASLASREVVREDGRWNNLLILVCDKLNDLPTFLYLNNPRARSIHLELPDRDERARFIRRYHPHFHGGAEMGEAPEATVREFVDFTEGLTNYEMRSLVSLSAKESIPVTDPKTDAPNIRQLSEMYKYGVTASEWDRIEIGKLGEAESFIHGRIKGQGAAIGRVLDIIKRAKIGLAAGDSRKSNRPRGVLFFAGPTGVGKTEMAKAMAALLFGREERLIRFDMSEYATQQSDQRLLGAPPGYVGYEEGGQLTNAVKKNPFSILLFDEIEKAHGSIFDKFLQILDDGRLTDGKGETVYFSECIIIFTSNLGTVARADADGAGIRALVTPDMPYNEMREGVLLAIRNHFNFVLARPEILNRFGDNFVVFDFIKPPVDAEIVDLLIEQLTSAANANRRIDLVIEAPVRDALVELARVDPRHGGRGVRNVVDFALVNPLSRTLFDQAVPPESRVCVRKLTDLGEQSPTRFELDIEAVTP
ncbi:MAG: AAA domain-containing protein [Nitrospiraceae bacterium]|nr:AAA domain-containing protein [Nitrospiraceae bacterium]